jgi:hypothetical protein
MTRDRRREILLFNAGEINSIFSGRITIEESIRLTREALRLHATAYLLDVSSNPDTSIGNSLRHAGSFVPMKEAQCLTCLSRQTMRPQHFSGRCRM